MPAILQSSRNYDTMPVNSIFSDELVTLYWQAVARIQQLADCVDATATVSELVALRARAELYYQELMAGNLMCAGQGCTAPIADWHDVAPKLCPTHKIQARGEQGRAA